MMAQLPRIQVRFITLAILISSAMTAELSAVRFLENRGSKLIATSNSNYAISSPELSMKNWRVVSVNGDNLQIVTLANERLQELVTRLNPDDQLWLQKLREEIELGTNGFTHMSSGFGGSNYMMSSDSSSTTSSTSMTSSIGVDSMKEQSINIKDENNFSVAKSDLPFNWSRVFFLGDVIAMVYRTGEVKMLPLSLLDSEEFIAANRLKEEVREMQAKQKQQVASTMQQSVDMVSNVFNNIMGRFPKPPDYQSAVGNMFGNSFPFGPNNSPFASASGWPFNGNGAFAFASGRR